ncbi:hypothetical protein SLEP1_g13901 [Rubroshorea leprosula]|uniref:non-specific serine/threonine protein kinase n=1 Tax=Rubroshorea leprosula TaxID=152421 RepID=A0AAV5ISZ0_9ROSI|nr:hypothetical protein SLEP1_g13901 [Rubroshorea leprosula]
MGNACAGNASKSGFLTFSWFSKSANVPKDDRKESSKSGEKEESSKDSKKEESSKDVKKEHSNGDGVECKETAVVAPHEKPPEPMKMAREEAVKKEQPTKPVEEAKVKLEPKRLPTRLSSKLASRSTRLNEENKPSEPERPASQSSRFNEPNKSSEPEKPKKPKHGKRSSCAGLQVELILQTKTGHLKEYYELGKKLGHGQFGTTFLCVEKVTGKEYACKSIMKRKLITEDDVDDIILYSFLLDVKLRSSLKLDIMVQELSLALCSCGYNARDVFNDVVGSPYYIAPEVLKKRYGPEADVWSAGVILYILLSGVPPFWGETEKEIFDGVLRGHLDFKSDPWPKISESAKDLVKKMLVRDPKKRISVHEVLCHPWVQVDGVAPDKPLDSIVLSRLKQFSAMNKLKKMALRVIAQRLSEEEIAGLKEMFKMIDTDNSGQITFEELKEGLKRFGADLHETEFHDLMQAADVDKSGTIDYEEFVAATLHLNKVEREEHLFAAFSYFDKDGSGYITQDELQQACKEFGIEDVQLEEMIQDADQDNDGRIDYNEFVAMMQEGNAEWGKKELQSTNFGIGFREASPVS